jgi:hypothetical protein
VVRFPLGARDFSVLEAVRTAFGVHPAQWLPGMRRPDREINYLLHLVPMYRTSGAISLFPLYASMACTRALLECSIGVEIYVTEKGKKVPMRINERKKHGQGSGKITSQGS